MPSVLLKRRKAKFFFDPFKGFGMVEKDVRFITFIIPGMKIEVF